VTTADAVRLCADGVTPRRKAERQYAAAYATWWLRVMAGECDRVEPNRLTYKVSRKVAAVVREDIETTTR